MHPKLGPDHFLRLNSFPKLLHYFLFLKSPWQEERSSQTLISEETSSIVKKGNAAIHRVKPCEPTVVNPSPSIHEKYLCPSAIRRLRTPVFWTQAFPKLWTSFPRSFFSKSCDFMYLFIFKLTWWPEPQCVWLLPQWLQNFYVGDKRDIFHAWRKVCFHFHLYVCCTLF